MKKLVSIIIMVVVMLYAFLPTTKASSFSFIATPNITSASKGDIITIDLKLADIDAGELGINTFECMFKYDEDMFEEVQIQSKNNWSITYNDKKENEMYGKLLAVLLGTGVATDQNIGTISLKIKEDTTIKAGDIVFTQVTTNDGQNLIPTTDKTITITIKDSTEDGTSDGNESGNNGANSGNEANENNGANGSSNQGINSSNQNSSNKKDPTTNPNKLPQTGENSIMIVACIVGMLAISISAYIEYRKCTKK